MDGSNSHNEYVLRCHTKNIFEIEASKEGVVSYFFIGWRGRAMVDGSLEGEFFKETKLPNLLGGIH
ncbi:hypothetical protein IEQ34_022509 [Dendrobium chrysotoxum]|uniref:Uncharacterized protein n=1 Tax=Dendrobium chrysotoxum TaxID=161865 RepID=A0AAV7FK66_DENCH|nr:hypothetical protein IEQ34_022509 [Dendrobium chrysotoxum]